MIKIDRGDMPLNVAAFVAPTVKGGGGARVTRAAREIERAAAYFTDAANFANDQKLVKGDFEFAVYKDRELALELERVFGTKCAYCESNFGAVTPDDVEHFRPKSAVTIDAGHIAPGYWWLAGEWTNLLVSCRDCNSGRYFRVPGQPKEVLLGKLAQFPLSDELGRYRGPGPGIGDELPLQLLLDPCNDDPAEHLTWNEDGLVLPKVGASGEASRKGAMSIHVYALQREGLVEARLATLVDFRLQVRHLQKAVRRLNRAEARGDAEDAADELETIGELKDKISRMLSPRAEYVGMLRDWVESQKAAGRLVALEQFKIDLSAPDLVLR